MERVLLIPTPFVKREITAEIPSPRRDEPRFPPREPPFTSLGGGLPSPPIFDRGQPGALVAFSRYPEPFRSGLGTASSPKPSGFITSNTPSSESPLSPPSIVVRSLSPSRIYLITSHGYTNSYETKVPFPCRQTPLNTPSNSRKFQRFRARSNTSRRPRSTRWKIVRLFPTPPPLSIGSFVQRTRTPRGVTSIKEVLGLITIWSEVSELRIHGSLRCDAKRAPLQVLWSAYQLTRPPRVPPFPTFPSMDGCRWGALTVNTATDIDAPSSETGRLVTPSCIR